MIHNEHYTTVALALVENITKEEAIERLKQNKAAAEFYEGMVQNTNAIENELKDIEAIDMAIEALSAEAVQGDGRNNIKRYPNCQMRTSLGNCDVIGGFCTSINAPICDAFHKLVEATQGEWVDDGCIEKCNQCGERREFPHWKFCPNCGADMRERRET